jgi:hypothetical protein
MALNNYAYYSTSTGLIENIVWVEDELVSTFVWLNGYAIVDIPNGLMGEWSTCGIGWSYIGGQFVEPPAPPMPEQVQPATQGAQTL